MSTAHAQGALLGLAIGDALGAPVEFCGRGGFDPVTGFRAGGSHAMSPGEWTDDTSMALCLADSLLARGGMDARDQCDRYLRWAREGYNSSRGHCYDIGGTVADALGRFLRSGDPFSGSTDPMSAGNGCIMRLAPVPIFFHDDREACWRASIDSARTTHQAPECLEATAWFGDRLWLALQGASRDELLEEPPLHRLHEPRVLEIARGAWRAKPVEAIRGSGYVVESLEAAVWCFAREDSFAGAVLAAVNLGLDADTTGAVCGQLAGACHGEPAIPREWVEQVHRSEQLRDIAGRLRAARGG